MFLLHYFEVFFSSIYFTYFYVTYADEDYRQSANASMTISVQV